MGTHTQKYIEALYELEELCSRCRYVSDFSIKRNEKKEICIEIYMKVVQNECNEMLTRIYNLAIRVSHMAVQVQGFRGSHVKVRSIYGMTLNCFPDVLLSQ